MQRANCIFCNIKTNALSQSIIAQSEHFWVIYDNFPITSPHFLIVPKEHLANYADLPLSQFKLLTKVVKALDTTNKFKPFLFEHGGIGQTVKHAHLHLIPFSYTLKTLLRAMDIPGELKEIPDISQVKHYKDYFLFKERKTFVYIPTSSIVEPGIITNTIAKLLDMPYPAHKRKKASKETIKKYLLHQSI